MSNPTPPLADLDLAAQLWLQTLYDDIRRVIVTLDRQLAQAEQSIVEIKHALNYQTRLKILVQDAAALNAMTLDETQVEAIPF